jgi:predicted amidophosphoribosyltransferase
VAKRPRKKANHATKFGICKRCGGRVRKHINRCKKCSEKNY